MGLPYDNSHHASPTSCSRPSKHGTSAKGDSGGGSSAMLCRISCSCSWTAAASRLRACDSSTSGVRNTDQNARVASCKASPSCPIHGAAKTIDSPISACLGLGGRPVAWLGCLGCHAVRDSSRGAGLAFCRRHGRLGLGRRCRRLRLIIILLQQRQLETLWQVPRGLVPCNQSYSSLLVLYMVLKTCKPAR
jgi:hypothetical protein